MSNATSTLGMGFCPLGFSLYGYGTPATAGFDSGSTLQKSVNGPSGDARQIDPYTRDYVIDSDGIIQGQSSISQQVFLAVITTRGTSVIPALGSTLSNIKTFKSATFQREVANIIQQALAGLIKNGSISLVNVSATINQNGVAGNIIINWIDNLTKQINQTTI